MSLSVVDGLDVKEYVDLVTSAVYFFILKLVL